MTTQVPIRVLVACEFSARVRDAFAALGCDAWSCDLIETEGSPSKHVQGRLEDLFRTRPGPSWDLVVGHPPCTYLCNSGVHLLRGNDKRWTMMLRAVDFFNLIWNCGAKHVAVENPIMHGYASQRIGGHTQLIQPYEYGEPESKATCLWLRNLPPLQPTAILPLPPVGYWRNQTPSGQNKLGSSQHDDRARTYRGIARAMANQWVPYIQLGGSNRSTRKPIAHMLGENSG